MMMMTMVKTGAQTPWTVAVRAQMKRGERALPWPWSSSRSKSKKVKQMRSLLHYHVYLPPHAVFVLRTGQESEKTGEKRIGKKRKIKPKERLEEEAEEEGGEEVEGGWEKVKGGAPMVKVKKSDKKPFLIHCHHDCC